MPKQKEPHSPEAESALLGALICSGEGLDKHLANLKADDFYIPKHKRLFRAVMDTFKAKGSVDAVLVRDQLGDDLKSLGGAEWLAHVCESVPVIDPDRYIKAVLDKSRLRQVLAVTEQLEEGVRRGMSPEEVYEWAEKLKADQKCGDSGLVADFVGDSIGAYERMRTQGVDLDTGIVSVDECMGGLRRGMVYTIGGKTSQGKTSIAMNVILRNLEANPTCRILYNGFENIDQIPMRLASIKSNLPLDHFLKPHRLSEVDYLSAREAMEGIRQYDSRLRVMSGASLTQMKAVIDGFHPDLVFLDYIQSYAHRYKLSSEDRLDHAIGQLTSELQSVAVSKRCAVIQMSQFRRMSEDSKGRKPSISDLKESGDIENVSDVILLLWWPWRETLDPRKVPQEYVVIVGKNKMGPCEEFTCHIQVETLKISSWQNVERSYGQAEAPEGAGGASERLSGLRGPVGFPRARLRQGVEQGS